MAKQTKTKQSTKKTNQTNQTAQDNKASQATQAKAQLAQEKELEKMIADNDSVELKFTWKEVNPLYVKELKKLAKNLKIKGFRKGSAPPELAAKEISPEKVIDAVLRQILPEAYEKAVKDGGFTPLTEPEFQAISLNKDNDWVIKASFAQKPEIKLGNWKKIVAEAKKKAQQDITDHNKKIEEANAKQSKSSKAKDTKKAKPADAQAPNQAQQPMNEQQQKDAIIQTILGNLAEQIKPAIPSLLIRQNTRRELDNFVKQLEQLNVKVEDFLKARNMTQDQLTMEMFLQSLNKLQVEFIINSIAEEEKIKADDKDVEKRIEEIEDEETKKKVKQDLQYQSYLRAVIAKQKVLDFLVK